MKVHVGSNSPCALLHRHFLLFPLISGSSFASSGRGVKGGGNCNGVKRNVHVSCIFQRSTFTLLSLEVLCRVFSSSFFIIFVIYETVFIISYCSLAAAGGLSTRMGNMPRPCSDFSKITRVFFISLTLLLLHFLACHIAFLCVLPEIRIPFCLLAKAAANFSMD